MQPDNPFACPSALPCHLPAFDRVRESDYRPAFLAGMAEQRAEIEAIASRPADPTATLVALERSGQLLERVSSVFFNLTHSAGTEPMLALEEELAPLLSEHRDAIYLNPRLYERIASLYTRREQLASDPEAQQLLERYHVAFLRAGAALGTAEQSRIRELNRELSILRTQFRQNVLRATREGALAVPDAARLAGLSSEQVGAAAEAARERGLTGHLLTLQNTTCQPALASLADRGLRAALYRASVSRCAGGPHDNLGVLTRIARLRAERAALLGYAHHAAYVLADENAGSTRAVDEMIGQVAGAALARARQQAARLQGLIDAEAAANGIESFALQPWDWHLYAERERAARFPFDAAVVRSYFELERVVADGLFHTAGQLYGLRFQRRTDLPVYHTDVGLYEVRSSSGGLVGLFLTDYYAREGKQGGAWMSNFVGQSHLLGQRPVIVNCLNIARPAPGEPTLLSFEEVTTLFHEFGHALHGLLSNVRYPLLSGTNVPRDFVEYPSQFHEMWAREPAVLARFARHWRTGEPLPEALLTQVLAAQNADQGYRTVEYLQAALIDQAWHSLTPQQVPGPEAVGPFEAAALERAGLRVASIPPRYHSPYFLHVFADDYPASYYAYLWSEVLARDTGRWFQNHGGLRRDNGERLQEGILSRGWTQDTQTLIRRFLGRPPQIGPLLDYRGLGSGVSESAI